MLPHCHSHAPAGQLSGRGGITGHGSVVRGPARCEHGLQAQVQTRHPASQLPGQVLPRLPQLQEGGAPRRPRQAAPQRLGALAAPRPAPRARPQWAGPEQGRGEEVQLPAARQQQQQQGEAGPGAQLAAAGAGQETLGLGGGGGGLGHGDQAAPEHQDQADQ